MQDKIDSLIINIQQPTIEPGTVQTAIMTQPPRFGGKLTDDARIRHSHTVAELMYEYYYAFDCKYLDREQIYALGLVHDIGYFNGPEGHEFDGAEIFCRLTKCNEKLICEESEDGEEEWTAAEVFTECIRNHGLSPWECFRDGTWSSEDVPSEMVLLWWADMCVESRGDDAGQIIGMQQRIENLTKLYGAEDERVTTCVAIAEFVTDWMLQHVPLSYSRVITE